MDSLKDIAKRQQQASPGYFEDPDKDRWLRVMLELGEEICVLRDRLDSCRLLAEQGKVADAEAIEALSLNEEQNAKRLAKHQAFFEALFEKLLSAETTDPQ